MRFVVILLLLILAATGVRSGGWTTWTEWSVCAGCEGEQQRLANCVSGGAGCDEGSRRRQIRNCGGACPVCMNNRVEEGEECDCGTEEECSDSCCDATTCHWKSGIECHTGQCCDTNTCTYRELDYVCRESADDCDIVERCNGATETCPDDLYKANKTNCNDNQDYCFNGRCQNSDTLCKQLYGAGASDGYTDCYEYNRGGTLYGNCGETGTNEAKIFTKCAREDVRCGLLQCINADQLTDISEYKYVSNRRVIITEESNSFTCRSIYAVKKTGNEVIGYANDGTVCGTEKVCQQKQCMSLSSISTPSCPIGTNGEVCSGRGVCNQNQECVCDYSGRGTACETAVTDGGWSEWQSWGICSETCDTGTRTRTRICNTPTPSNGGSNCVGTTSQVGTCNEEACPAKVDGGWGEWSPFTECSKPCGGGVMLVYRKCDSPAALNGGKKCLGQPNKINNCNEHNCAVEGGWSSWQAWSDCTRRCGGGTRTRNRACDTPAPSDGGTDCIGTDSEYNLCNTNSCTVPVNGGWGTWASWTTCSATCGDGTVRRSRECDTPTPANGGDTCVGSGTSVDVCNIANCPVHGSWGSWGAWGSCTSICGTSDRYRYRQCDTPAPLYGGEECIGDEYESDACNGPACEVPVNGGWGTWTSWTTCSATCGDGTVRRSRECDTPTPANGGDTCVGNERETQTCNLIGCSDSSDWSIWTEWTPCDVTCGVSFEKRQRNRDCQEHTECSEQESRICNRVPCIVYTAGGWSGWSEWGSCSQTCGDGQRTRTRGCDSPPRGVLGPDCVGESSQTEVCSVNNCPGDPIDGAWSDWSDWAPCSRSCGNGVNRRSRQCNSPIPVNGGRFCTGDRSGLRGCNSQTCPDVDGGWGEWDSWSSCSVTCGNGTETRTRECDNPVPKGAGADCTENNSESQQCNAGICPVDGGWGEWSGFGECTVSCGGGIRTRIRDCDNPRNSNGGLECVGGKVNFENCNQHSCETPDWSNWSEWSSCLGTCGRGEQRRNRTCVSPQQQSAALECEGARITTKQCELTPCGVDGDWSEWSDWSECTASCGSGGQTRTRTCDNPEPTDGGSSCSGEGLETQVCNEIACLACTTSSYRLVSTCSRPCDVSTGMSYYTRCLLSGSVSSCRNKRVQRIKTCKNGLCNKQKDINISSQCFVWLDPETLEPQCGTETDMVSSLQVRLCSDTRILELESRQLDVSNVTFDCLLDSGQCVKVNN